jgi:hypothetical protein
MKEVILKHKIEVILISYIIASFLLVDLLVIPLIDKTIQKSDMIQEKNLDNQIEEKRIGKIPEMEKSFSEYQSNKDALQVVFSNSEQFEIIKSLETVAQETGNNISKLVVNDASKVSIVPRGGNDVEKQEKNIIESLSNKDYLSFQISIIGKYGNLFHFLQKIENTRYYMNIISISTTKQKKSDISKDKARQNSTDIFPSSNSPEEINPTGEVNPEDDLKKDEEILTSDINLIVYIKK